MKVIEWFVFSCEDNVRDGTRPLKLSSCFLSWQTSFTPYIKF